MKDLVQYPDGLWGVALNVPREITNTGKRGKLRQKVGTLEEARRFASWCRAHFDQGVMPPVGKRGRPPTIAERIDRYESDLPKGSPIRSYCRIWKEVLGSLRVDKLQVSHLRDWVSAAKKEMAPATVHRKFQVLQRVYSIAEEDGILTPDQNPFHAKKRLGLPPVSNEREHFLTREEERRLYRLLGYPWCLFLEFSLLTGMRQANQLGLRKEDIDHANSLAMLEGSKTKQRKRHPVLLLPRALEIIEENAITWPDSPWCFPTPTGKRWTRHNFRKRVWRPAFDAAGLEEVRWHDTRHSVASRLANSGHGLEVIRVVLGHSTDRMTRRYAHLTDETVRRALEDL